MALSAMTPRYRKGVSGPNSQMRRIRDVAAVGRTEPEHADNGADVHRRRDQPAVVGSGGFEIVGRHAVQKLLELLHLVLSDGAGRLVVALVGNQ